ncbi:MAG TPA: hypothetical protein VI997_04820, partial [Candidatus Thermoplasmatota archaeon]|nr:hypothetical protein [Candidatus Thermoplasmatota archaeon]
HRLLFERNTIVDPLGFGLRYNDRNHAGDDRQATSEQEPALELPHSHETHVAFLENTVDGAPFLVEIFMAKDELHGLGRGELLVEGNRIVNATMKDGIFLTAVGEADVRLVGNVVEKSLALLGSGSGIRLVGFEDSTIEILDNRIDGFRHGVSAQAFDGATRWTVAGNRITGAEQDVWWDESVPNAPEQGDRDADDEHDHEAAASSAEPLSSPAPSSSPEPDVMNPVQEVEARGRSTIGR